MDFSHDAKMFIDILTHDGSIPVTPGKTFYYNLLDLDNGNGSHISQFIDEHPLVLAEYLDDRHVVYDYIYDYVLNDKCHPTAVDDWIGHLIKATGILAGIGEKGELIKTDKRYVLNLQSGCKCHIEIFTELVENYFETGDFTFLLYTVVARGEVAKLKVLNENFDGVDGHTELIDVALRYGRHIVLEYLMDVMAMSPTGRVLEFEGIRSADNPRLVYYYQYIGKNFEDFGDIIGSTQDYIQCYQTIMETYEYPVTVKTLDVWCNLARDKVKQTYKWDRIPNELLVIIKNQVDSVSPIPISHDFGEFNSILFGDWSNHTIVIKQHLELQEKYQRLEERYESLLYKYSKLSKFKT